MFLLTIYSLMIMQLQSVNMEKKKIICNIKMGMFKHNLYIILKDEIIETFNLSLTEIPNFIAQRKDIQDVYLTGLNKNFLKKIEKETKDIEYKLYTQNNKIFHYEEIQ